MTVEELLADLAERGVGVSLNGDLLTVRGELSDDDVVTLEWRKPEIVAHLRGGAEPSPVATPEVEPAPTPRFASYRPGRSPQWRETLAKQDEQLTQQDADEDARRIQPRRFVPPGYEVRKPLS